MTKGEIMKSMRVVFLAIVLGLMAALECQAFYNPDTGRWLNRDPIEEFAFLQQHTDGTNSDAPLGAIKQAMQTAYAFAGNNPIERIDIVGLETVQIVVTTVIRPPDAQAGVKTIHIVVINEYGRIVSKSTFTGSTSVLGYPAKGSSRFREWTSGSHPNFTVTMIGNAHSAALPSFMDIDYNFDIHLNFCAWTGHLIGMHDGYPSYLVRVKRNKIYDWQQRSIRNLFGSGGITVDKDFNW
jgi:hypothetical protein